MIPVKNLIKKHLPWMILSYIIAGIVLYVFLLNPQKSVINEYLKKKSEIEYAYMKITSSPSFLNALKEAVTVATIKTDDFFWLDRDIDRGLALYNYLYSLANQTNVELLEIVAVEKTSTTSKKDEKEKLYYRWKVKLTGRFPDVVSFIEKIENSRKFLMVYEISIKSEKKPGSDIVYEITLLGLKNSKGDDEEDGKI